MPGTCTVLCTKSWCVWTPKPEFYGKKHSWLFAQVPVYIDGQHIEKKLGGLSQIICLFRNCLMYVKLFLSLTFRKHPIIRKL